jgi:hypothetical protein
LALTLRLAEQARVVVTAGTFRRVRTLAAGTHRIRITGRAARRVVVRAGGAEVHLRARRLG